MLVSGFHRKLARLITASLLVAFIVYLILGMLGGWAHECGCYGTAVVMKPQWTIIQDGILVLVLTLLDRTKTEISASPYTSLRFGLVLSAAALVTAMASQSPFLDRFLVRLRPGLEMPNLPTVAIEAANDDRTRLAILMDEMPKTSELTEIKGLYPNHELVLITTREMSHTTDDSFTVVPGKKAILPFYYHHLPTAFIVVDSIVTEVWYGSLPISTPEKN